jgi:hypothetical protein
MDGYSFTVALVGSLSSLIAALITFWQTGARENRERKEREEQRTEDRDEKLRERRLMLFLGFLQDCNAVRHAIASMAAASTSHGMEPEAPAWKEALKSLQDAKQSMQRSFDTLCLVDTDRVARASYAVVALVQPGIDIAKHPSGVDSAAFAAWEGRADKAEGELRDLLRSEYKAKVPSAT